MVQYEEQFTLEWEFDRLVPVSSSQVALAAATLCGTQFKNIEFDFEVEESVLATVRKFTRGEVDAVPTPDAPRPLLHDGNVLSFSGGFDSFSAWRLMPESSHLVSLDFGGWFEREADFFQDFDTLVVSTNMRSMPTLRTPLTRNHWSFMAVGAILTARHFNVKHHSFGSILGESLSSSARPVPTLPVLEALGFKEAGYARGLTEVGTASVILRSDPSRVVDSLRSLSGPRDRKIFRKTALSEVVAKKIGVAVDLPKLDYSRSPQIKFGDDYASSLSALYCLGQGRGDSIEGLFESVPEEARKIGDELSLDFMEKINWDAYSGFPSSLQEGLWSKFAKFRLEPYGERDWAELSIVRDYLSRAYSAAHAAPSV
ncbi:hypothetical protein ACT3TE_09615 [Brachybacterium sp. AOP42-B2-9]|uniref:hypothetical protein n=1 Tax=Brachybacterium sp. AOP42-B2-9 TaxID=3457672 RepID=UPI004034685A